MASAREATMSWPATIEVLSDNRTRLTVIVISVLAILTFIIRFVRYRQEYRKITGSLTAPPFSLVFGNLLAFVELGKGVPADAHPHSLFTLLHRKLNLSGVFYADAWPLFPERQMVISDPGVAAQIVQGNMRKHSTVKAISRHVCGPTSMLFAEGAMWKRARTMFNSGFALSHLMTLLPAIVEDAVIFSQVLARSADSEEVLQIESAAKKLAIDVMGRVVLDVCLKSQTERNELVEAFVGAVNATPEVFNYFALSNVNPIPYFKRWYYEQVMDRYLEKALDERLKYRKLSSDGQLNNSKRGRKPIIDLAIDEYYAEQEAEAASGKKRGSVKELKRFSIDQMKTFLFAGHDTTSSALSYVYYLLGHHPAAVAKLRNEFDVVFGPNSTLTESRMRENPQLIHKLDYTTAVIKETLRLYPPATTVKEGDGSSIIYEGKSYPTGNDLIWLQTHTLHRRADLYPSPDEFIPERFLPAPNNSQEVVKDSWRAFEKGPRACLGQELAMMEIKIVMALTLRDFDIRDAFEEWDRKLGRERPGDDLDGRRGMFGYRSYQILQLTAKPVDGMPVKVKRRTV